MQENAWKEKSKKALIIDKNRVDVVVFELLKIHGLTLEMIYLSTK